MTGLPCLGSCRRDTCAQQLQPPEAALLVALLVALLPLHGLVGVCRAAPLLFDLKELFSSWISSGIQFTVQAPKPPCLLVKDLAQPKCHLHGEAGFTRNLERLPLVSKLLEHYSNTAVSDPHVFPLQTTLATTSKPCQSWRRCTRCSFSRRLCCGSAERRGAVCAIPAGGGQQQATTEAQARCLCRGHGPCTILLESTGR